MHCEFLTIFPEIIRAYFSLGILRRAVEKDIVRYRVHDLRDFTKDRHRTVDDYPYGGGPGMVMKPEPFYSAVRSVTADGIATCPILLSPQGKVFDQKMAGELSRESRRLLFICGRYEGIDDRVRDGLAEHEISVGDYVLTGGELAALVIIDALVRLLPGALGDEYSKEEESFSWGILDYPHYTRPPEYEGRTVPEVLLSGNHREIVKWRRKEALRRTVRMRPDLLARAEITEQDKILLKEIKEEDNESVAGG